MAMQTEALPPTTEALAGHGKTGSGPTHNITTLDPIFTKGPFWRLWLNETVSMIMSLLLLAAVVAVLAAFDGVPQPDWGSKISLTLNSLIAILSTLCRAMLMLVVAEGKVHLVQNEVNGQANLSDALHSYQLPEMAVVRSYSTTE